MNGEHKRSDYENFDGKHFCDGCGSRGRCSTCERKSVRFPGAVGYCGEADNGVSVRVDTDLGGMLQVSLGSIRLHMRRISIQPTASGTISR